MRICRFIEQPSVRECRQNITLSTVIVGEGRGLNSWEGLSIGGGVKINWGRWNLPKISMNLKELEQNLKIFGEVPKFQIP